jgi:hypothetical protein
MMQDSLSWVIAALIGLGWTLSHAVRTLSRMQGKTLYPLLRRRTKDGRCSPVVMARTLSPAVHLPPTATGHQW